MTRKQTEARWTKKADTALTGKRVKAVRYLSADEVKGLAWHSRPLVIEFEDGTLLYPSRDDEGNDGGALFGQGPKGEDLLFPVLR